MMKKHYLIEYPEKKLNEKCKKNWLSLVFLESHFPVKQYSDRFALLYLIEKNIFFLHTFIG